LSPFAVAFVILCFEFVTLSVFDLSPLAVAFVTLSVLEMSPFTVADLSPFNSRRKWLVLPLPPGMSSKAITPFLRRLRSTRITWRSLIFAAFAPLICADLR